MDWTEEDQAILDELCVRAAVGALTEEEEKLLAELLAQLEAEASGISSPGPKPQD